MNFSFTHWRSCVQNVLVFNFDQIQRIDFAGVLSGSDTFRKRKSTKWPSRGKTLPPSSSQRAGPPCLIRFWFSLPWESDSNPPLFKTSAEDFGIGSTPTLEDLPALPLELQAYKDSAKVTENFPSFERKTGSRLPNYCTGHQCDYPFVLWAKL